MNEIKKDLFIGRDDEGSRYYLSLRITTHEGEAGRENIHHNPCENYYSLGIMGEIIAKGARNAHWGGQMVDETSKVTKFESGLTWKEVRRIISIWERWHLNDFNSHCAHQDSAITWDEVAPCGGTGYEAGSAWLVEELPDEIVEELLSLFKIEKVSA